MSPQPATQRQIDALSRAGVNGSAMTFADAKRELAKRYKGNTLAYWNGEERKAAGLKVLEDTKGGQPVMLQ